MTKTSEINAIQFEKFRIRFLDQRWLPIKEVYVDTSDYVKVISAIKTLAIRGAPLIGVAAGYGIVMAVKKFSGQKKDLRKYFQDVCHAFKAARPTAVNLFYAVDRMKKVFDTHVAAASIDELRNLLLAEAVAIHDSEIESCDQMAMHGAKLIKKNSTALTHCNTGVLATGGIGTALGVILKAYEQGKIKKVIACETRPLLQGLRLTAWELEKLGIPFEVISDSSAAFLMQKGEIDFVITGSDRIAANGDAANKIGTYSHAALASVHKIPFYIAAPTSTIDATLQTGKDIVIEERSGDELRKIFGKAVGKENFPVRNYAFDVTPAPFITAIITERGVFKKPYRFAKV
jgi:methylthioribose-1-phosphate isomerase